MVKQSIKRHGRGGRTWVHLRRYLADYAQDRALVGYPSGQEKVDRIYHLDPRIPGYTAHWHDASSTPYLYKRKRSGSVERFVYAAAIPPEQAQAIRHDHRHR